MTKRTKKAHKVIVHKIEKIAPERHRVEMEVIDAPDPPADAVAAFGDQIDMTSKTPLPEKHRSLWQYIRDLF